METRKLTAHLAPKIRIPFRDGLRRKAFLVLTAGAVGILVVSSLALVVSYPSYGFDENWSRANIKVAGGSLDLKWTSAIYIYGAIDGLRVLVPFEIQSSSSSSRSFNVNAMTARTVTPVGGGAILVDDGIPSTGDVVARGSSVSWNATIIPHFAKQPPLQFQLTIDCSVSGKKFQLGANAIFRTRGPMDAQALTIERVPAQSVPDLPVEVWGGVTYYYSIECTYPLDKGVSSYIANLSMSFTGEQPFQEGGLVVELVGPVPAVVPLTLNGVVATGAIQLNQGTLISPGYVETIHLRLVFAAQSFPAQAVTLSFAAVAG